MNSKRSYLDTLNAGRPRRPHTSLEELNRTLETLESRLEAGRRPLTERAEDEDIARRMQRLAGHAAWPNGASATPDARDRPTLASSRPQAQRSFDSLARDIESARMQEEGMATVGRIAGELRELREEMRHQMTEGLHREFDALRRDIERAAAAAAAGAQGAELGHELERLSAAIRSLAERSDDNSVKMLRLEIEQVKEALDTLAREETVRSFGQRWEDFDRRWDAAEQRQAAPDPALEALNARLEQIANAVNDLPESLSLRSLEEKVRTLAGAIEQFSRQEQAAPQAFEMIGERLDEISRAIVASTTAPVFDPQPFERIEARITSLARQIEELADDGPVVRAVVEGLTQLTQRVDEIAQRADLPEKTVRKLAQQIAAISDKLDAGHTADAEHMLKAFETRFAGLSEMLQQRQHDASLQGQTQFRGLEKRLDDLAARLDSRSDQPAAADPALMDAIDARLATFASRLEHPAGDEAIRNLEARLEDIAGRLDQSARHSGNIDPELIRNLEAQVAGLSAHLSRPGNPLPEFEDIGPRLDHIEQSITQSREAILSAARQAAEEAVRGFAGSPQDQAAVSALAADLKSLEALARRSDERNNKTFEAIHDTLLKIVERLGSLETRRASALPETGFDEIAETKLALESPPPMDPEAFEPSLDEVHDSLFNDDRHSPADERYDSVERSPSEAAAAAALAAVSGEVGEARSRPRKGSLLGGLTRALSGRGKAAEPVAQAGGDVAEGNLALAPEIDLDEPLDPAIANRPLEPGSGAPDLHAIMKRVRDDRAKPAGPAGASDAAKSDFIAAARRAAQAAAAEAEILKKQAEKKNAGSGKFNLGDLFRSKRKPLLMAAGAILMALAGLQLGKAFLADEERAVAADAPAVEEPLADETAVDAAASVEEPAQAAIEAPAEQPPATRNIELTAAEPAADAVSRQPIETAAEAQTEPVAEAVDEAASPQAAAETAVEIEEPALEASSPVPSLEEIPVEAGPIALREAAADGDPKAMFEIGARYAEEGSEALAEAAKWYRMAADLGFAPAQYRIGNFYEKGFGVERDIAKAKTWYQLAAEQGNASAMHNLAVLFAMGADGAPDNESAARWFAEAAEVGVIDSQFNLGILAAKGVGMPQDLEESYKWFALVAKKGDQDAAAKRDEIAKALSPEQLEKARATAELWKAKPLDPEANAVEIPDSWKESEETTASVDMEQAVRNIQLILNEKGYDAGGVDGVMGARTKSAIAAFQKENGMAPTGEVDKDLVQALLEKG